MPTKLFEKGKPRAKNAGRKKGTLNKFTTLKQAYLDAFNNKEMGSTQGLIDAFKVNLFTKREFYKLISKMLPSNVTVDGDLNVSFHASEKFMPKTGDGKK